MFRFNPVKELRKNRESYVRAAQELIEDSNGNWTGNHKERYAKLMTEINTIDDDILLGLQDRIEKTQTRATPISGEWQNSYADDPRIYGKGELICESKPRYHIGGLMAALVDPRKMTPEIRDDLSEGQAAEGGVTVPQKLLKDFVDLLRSRLVSARAGVRVIVTDTNQTTMAKILTDPVCNWRAEHEEIVKSSPTYDKVDLGALNLGCLVIASRELIMDSINIREMLLQQMAAQAALVVDTSIFYGDSATNPKEPNGIVNTAGVQSQAVTASLTDYGPIISGISALAAANVDPSKVSVVLSPRDWFALGALQDSTGQPMETPPVLVNTPILTSTIVQTNEGAGTNESRVFIADYSTIILAMRQRAEIQVLRERYSEFNQIGFRLTLRCDVAMTHPQAALMLTGILP